MVEQDSVEGQRIKVETRIRVEDSIKGFSVAGVMRNNPGTNTIKLINISTSWSSKLQNDLNVFSEGLNEFATTQAVIYPNCA